MKILVCVHNFNNGGAERVAALWINGFVQRGNAVKVLTCGKASTNDYDIPDDVQIENINPIGNLIARNCTRIACVRSILKSFTPDVVILIQKPWIWWITFAKIGLKIPVINTEHNAFERPPSAPMPWKIFFEKFYLNKVFSSVTVLTKADSRVIGSKIKHVYVMPNPLAFNPIDYIKERKKSILAMGRIDVGYTKGFDILIKAFAKVDSGWSLQIAGAGRDENIIKYKKLAQEYGVENKVGFIGYVKDPVKLFRESSIFVLSSRFEGFGLVLIEAMSQGCACIACDYKGRQSEIVLDETMGLTCPTDDVEALAGCIKRLIDDDSYRESIRKKAVERSKDYSLDRIMDRWERIFKDLNLL